MGGVSEGATVDSKRAEQALSSGAGPSASAVSSQPAQEHSSSSEVSTSEPLSQGAMDSTVTDYSNFDDTSVATTSAAGVIAGSVGGDDDGSGYPSLIAAPSHFAISIFERLDPVPSPVALSTAAQLQYSIASSLLSSSMGGGGVDGGGESGDVRVFAFDVPSPDDVVFRAQGQRPAATRT
ncbi:hypothetical protein BGX33_010968 [Mortierella sp. NVP41]|nr:hypothetical protein BGX33_010968 [Mortierella sp. NVP41]